ncbi:unnamed protein product [Angiostrongylus costaricensis]|uniref:Endonuclease/exonuclease/phosphatase n=1 Tax=Angiostrongylus costaricensis TaxID=334426 RepID=A0A0R3PMK7_ANGCS|nr:unnamed protein product [Angiostrongylus costaricensis]
MAKVKICTYNACTLVSESSIEDLIMRARRTRYGAIRLAEMGRRRAINTVCNIGEVFLGTCDSRGISGIGVLVNMSLAVNIN